MRSLPPKIDLHCHLLPGVDDGPKTLKDALLLARSLADQGFSHVVATPHYIEDYSRDFRNRVEEAYTRFKGALEAEKIPLTVYLGGELMLIPGLGDLAKRRELPTLNGTRYVLVELPLYQPLPLYMEEVFFTLKARGYIPLLAHPERVEAFKKNSDKLYKLIQSGVLVQVNMGSLAGLYGSSANRLARKLLQNNLAAFLATDSHDASRVNLIAGELKKNSYSLDLLRGNPKKVLDDEEVHINPKKPALSLAERARKILGF